jgi:hypothetical protein
MFKKIVTIGLVVFLLYGLGSAGSIQENLQVSHITQKNMEEQKDCLSINSLTLQSEHAYIGKITVSISSKGVTDVKYDFESEMEVNWSLGSFGDFVEGCVALNYSIACNFNRGLLEILPTYLKVFFNINHEGRVIHRAWRWDYVYEKDRIGGSFTAEIELPVGQQMYNLTATNIGYKSYLPGYSDQSSSSVAITVYPILPDS